jgi:hypothetical protein
MVDMKVTCRRTETVLCYDILYVAVGQGCRVTVMPDVCGSSLSKNFLSPFWRLEF